MSRDVVGCNSAASSPANNFCLWFVKCTSASLVIGLKIDRHFITAFREPPHYTRMNDYSMVSTLGCGPKSGSAVLVLAYICPICSMRGNMGHENR